MSSDFEYPCTCVFTWKSTSAPDAINRIMSDIISSSEATIQQDFHMQIILKKVNQKNLPSELKKNSRKSDESTTYFVRFTDCSKCCVIPKAVVMMKNPEIKNVFICDESIEELLTSSSDLLVRSTCRTTGRSFLIHPFLISVGTMEHGSQMPVPVLEITYFQSSSTNSKYGRTSSLLEISALCSEFVYHLLKQEELLSLKSHHEKGWPLPGDTFCLSHRALQWISAASSSSA